MHGDVAFCESFMLHSVVKLCAFVPSNLDLWAHIGWHENWHLCSIKISLVSLLPALPTMRAKQVLFSLAYVSLSVSLCVCPHKKTPKKTTDQKYT